MSVWPSVSDAWYINIWHNTKAKVQQIIDLMRQDADGDAIEIIYTADSTAPDLLSMHNVVPSLNLEEHVLIMTNSQSSVPLLPQIYAVVLTRCSWTGTSSGSRPSSACIRRVRATTSWRGV